MAAKWHKWKLWTFIVLLPAVALAIANHKVFPDAFWLLLVLLCVTVGVSQWMQSYSDIDDDEVKQIRQWVEFGLAFALFANLAYHAYFARGVSEREQGLAELHAEQDREQAREQARLDAENKRKLAEKEADERLTRAEAEKAAAEAKREANEAWKLDRFRRAGGQLVGGIRRATPTVSPSPIAGSSPVPSPVSSPKTEIDMVPKTEIVPVEPVAVFRARHSFWLFLFGIFETAIAVLGGAFFLTKLHQDSDKNGLPDWMDRALASGRMTMEQLRTEYGRRFKRAFTDKSASLPSPAPRANFDAGSVRKNRPEPSEKPSGENRPDADSCEPSEKPSGESRKTTRKKASGQSQEESSGAPIWEGNRWRVLGVTLPDVEGVRYEGRWKRGCINVIPTEGETHGYLANLGKRELAELAAMSEAERFSIVRDKIEAAKVRASERAFEREG